MQEWILTLLERVYAYRTLSKWSTVHRDISYRFNIVVFSVSPTIRKNPDHFECAITALTYEYENRGEPRTEAEAVAEINPHLYGDLSLLT